MKRFVVPELLDSDSGTRQEVLDTLADLRMFNRRFGGVRTMTELLRQVAGQRGLKEMSWLDVAGGAGDVAVLTQQSLSRSGIKVHPVVLDRADTHLNGTAAVLEESGAAQAPRSQGGAAFARTGVKTRSPERPFLNVCGDALALPFRDSSFDVVGSSLFVHHLLPEALARFTAEALRVARHAFVINDLIRNPLHYVVALAGRLIYRSRLTRHDAPASVRAAYTVDEVRSILSQSGATALWIQEFYFYRMGVIAWKEGEPTTT